MTEQIGPKMQYLIDGTVSAISWAMMAEAERAQKETDDQMRRVESRLEAAKPFMSEEEYEENRAILNEAKDLRRRRSRFLNRYKRREN